MKKESICFYPTSPLVVIGIASCNLVSSRGFFSQNSLGTGAVFASFRDCSLHIELRWMGKFKNYELMKKKCKVAHQSEVAFRRNNSSCPLKQRY